MKKFNEATLNITGERSLISYTKAEIIKDLGA